MVADGVSSILTTVLLIFTELLHPFRKDDDASSVVEKGFAIYCALRFLEWISTGACEFYSVMY